MSDMKVPPPTQQDLLTMLLPTMLLYIMLLYIALQFTTLDRDRQAS